MKRLLVPALLALPALMAAGSSASAQCSGPGCAGGPGASPTGAFWGCSHAGCGGFCFRFLGAIHQHGPLFNYGPYQGYYPFQPYGPWTSDLRYTGPHTAAGGFGHGHGHGVSDCAYGWLGKCGHCGGLLGSRGCGQCGGGLLGQRHGGCADGSCGWEGYSRSTFRNVFHRVHPLAHKCGAGCCLDGDCGSGSVVDSVDPVGVTTLTNTAAAAEAPGELQLTGHARRER